METTFAKLKTAGACTERYRHLAKSLGGIKKYGKNTPITAMQILDSNGLDDVLWAWAARLLPNDRVWRHFAADCAENVLHLWYKKHPNDHRPKAAIQAARDFADGKIDAAARDAARAAAGAAWAAAGAAWDAARDAARDAAWDAARAAARDAAWDAARAARDAAGAAWDAARDAARAAARDWQSKRLRWYLSECEWGPKQGGE